MNKPVKINDRNKEIVTYFYMIFGHRIHHGVEPARAKNEAYDAVTLRYGITKGTLFNIISAVKISRNVNNSAFRQNVLSLIENLESVNEEMASVRDRNTKLISLLKDCLEDADR